MPPHDGKTEFIKAAAARLRDAEELLQPPTLSPNERGADTRHLRSTMYLARYSVECVLKAYIISQSKVSTLTEALDRRRAAGEQIGNIMGAEGHRLSLLLTLSGLDTLLNNETELKKDCGTCCKWDSTWRYDPVNPKRGEAEGFMLAVRRVHDWVKRHID